MRNNTLDLGDLSKKESLLIFGGCYSNLEATQALYDWAQQRGYEAGQCICTGDIVAYCANPVETVNLIKEWGVACIQGNVEQSLAEQSDDCGCGFESGTTCDTLSRGWFSYASNLTTQLQRQWFASLPEQLTFSFGGKRIQVVHGAVSSVSRFMFDSQADQDFLEEFEKIPQIDLVIAGHSGLPFTKKVGGKIWHNSGALGMPANDGTQRVWFSTVEVKGSGEILIAHHSLTYHVQGTTEAMSEQGLTQGYHESLQTGLWPSMDVLPDKEIQQQGVSLLL